MEGLPSGKNPGFHKARRLMIEKTKRLKASRERKEGDGH